MDDFNVSSCERNKQNLQRPNFSSFSKNKVFYTYLNVFEGFENIKTNSKVKFSPSNYPLNPISMSNDLKTIFKCSKMCILYKLNVVNSKKTEVFGSFFEI